MAQTAQSQQAAANPTLNLSRLGQLNLAQNLGYTDAWQMFLDQYTGEVLTAYEEEAIMNPLIRQKTIVEGKSTTFPMTGRTHAEYFTPGNEIKGEQIAAGERTVLVDDLMFSAQSIYNLDEAMNYYEVRSIYSTESGRAIGQLTDKNIIRTLIKAGLAVDVAAAADLVQSYKQFDEESFIANVMVGDAAGDELDPAALDYAILQALHKWRLANIPVSGVKCVLHPEQYLALQDTRDANKMNWRNSLYGGVQGSNGTGVPPLHGVPVLSSNNFQADTLWNNSTGVSSSVRPNAASVGSGRTEAYDMPTDYLETALAVVGAIFCPDAVCKVNLKGMALESAYEARHQSTLMITSKAEGINILNPAKCILLVKHV